MGDEEDLETIEGDDVVVINVEDPGPSGVDVAADSGGCATHSAGSDAGALLSLCLVFLFVRRRRR